MTKKILLFTTLATLMCGAMHAQQVEWKTIEQAAKTDTKANAKLYFVDFYTSWCGWCKKMDKDTYEKSVVAAIMNHYYISVHFDAETKNTFSWNGKEYSNTASRRGNPHDFTRAVLGSQIGYPSVAIFDQQMNLVQVLSGYQGPDDFIKFICFFVNDNYKKYSYQKYMEIFDTQIYPEIKKEVGIK